MIPIKIDISDFVEQWNLTAQEEELFIENVLDEVSTRFTQEWHNTAGEVLKQTKKEYQESIYIEKIEGAGTVIVGLKGWLPNAIEQGIEPFDMKEGFKNSSKRKFKKDGGWYLTIPFRFGTPGIVGESEIFSNIMPEEVYKAALSELRGSSKKQLSAKSLPAEFQVKGVRPEVKNNTTGKIFEAYQHKASIYEGMRRSNKEHHGHYMTFRRVSDRSDENAWIHTGIEPRNLMNKTLQNFNIGDIIRSVRQKFLDNYR